MASKETTSAKAAKTSTDATNSAAKPAMAAAGSSLSAEKPAATGTSPARSPLSHLTAQSARFIVCEVVIFNPIARKREYTWQSQKRTSFNFQCMLVSTADPTQYMLGSAHGKGMNETKLNQLKDKFKPGLVFHMSKIAFAENTNQQYNSTPKTEVVSMLNTTWNPVLVSAGKPNIAEPSIPIVASMGIEHEQTFDAMALIQDVSPVASGGRTTTGQARVRCQAILNDGSLNETTGTVCHLPVTIFADATTDGQEPLLFQKLRQAVVHKTAMAFFGIQGKKAESDTSSGKWSFQSSFGFFCERASNTARGKTLEAGAAQLLAAQAEAIPQAVLQSRTMDDHQSFADTEAIETTCALFKSIMARTKVQAIETDTSFWQINWCHVHPPEKAAEVCTKDSSRLWMQVRVEDETGQLNIYMREKAALSLARTESKEDFEAARADDTLDFPNKASIRIIRKPAAPHTPTAGDTDEEDARIQCYIVEAAEQAMEDTPSKSSLTLLRLLEHTEARTDACAPASLSMIKKDPHYGLSISYMVENKSIKKRCTRAVALVRASSASRSDNMNEGFQMITEEVRDPLDESFVCTLMSFCTLRTSPDYQLKPARGMKTQTAFVVIADVLEAGSAEKPPVFLVESLEKVPDTEAEAAPDHMRRRIQFASLVANMQGKSAKRDWTEDTSPAIAGKCRRLGKSPTDDLLDKYKQHC